VFNGKRLRMKNPLSIHVLCSFWLGKQDADTVIMNNSIAMESFLPRSHDMLLTEQKGDSWNAGAWIIRKSEWSLQFLDAWWNMSSFVMPKGLAISGDNDALKYYLTHHQELFDSHILTVPRCYFNSVATWIHEGQDPTIAQEQIRLRVGTSNSDYQIYHLGDFVAHVAGEVDKMKGTLELLKDVK
jgi:galactosyl transferase GMA12/MNN10 family